METPREFAEAMAGKMKSILESGSEAIPIVIARMKDGKSLSAGFEMSGDADKDKAAMAMRMLAKIPEIDYVVFLCDAWQATLKPEAKLEEVMEQGLRNYPGRTEAIVASIFGRNRFTEVGSWGYERVGSKVVFSPKMNWHEPGYATGRFAPESPASGGIQ